MTSETTISTSERPAVGSDGPAADPELEPDPWAGIPEELVERTSGFDTDTAGGCG